MKSASRRRIVTPGVGIAEGDDNGHWLKLLVRWDGKAPASLEPSKWLALAGTPIRGGR
jgi:hypothetical protein